jgi:hypothetical protein
MSSELMIIIRLLACIHIVLEKCPAIAVSTTRFRSLCEHLGY